jgi:hypothetical protein
MLIEGSESNAGLIVTYLGESETADDLKCALALAKGRAYLQANLCRYRMLFADWQFNDGKVKVFDRHNDIDELVKVDRLGDVGVSI